LVSKTNLIAERKREMEEGLSEQIQKTLEKLADDSYGDGVISGIKMCIEFTKAMGDRVNDEAHRQTIMAVTGGLKDILVQQLISPHPSQDKSDQRIAP
jgi:hypothetical protein